MIDRALAWLAGKLLLRLGKRAYARGDMHEYFHARDALNAGACNGKCSLHTP